jgi:anti-anti-sigma factor
MNNPFGSQERTHASGAGALGEVALTVEFDERDDVLVATVAGVLDFYSAGPCQEQLNTALNHGATKLVLDLEGATFIDSTGLSLLISIQRRVHAAGGWLRLANPHPQLRRILHTTNLDGHFEIYNKVAEAVTAS